MNMPSAAPASLLELAAGELRLALRPDLGGSVAGLWHGGQPVLRSTEAAALGSARAAACFPLVPYSGRLGYRRFRWLGHEYTTAANFGDNPHSAHGLAWQRAWSVASAGATEAVLRLAHEADADWPFAFEIEQRFLLAPDALTVHLRATNRAIVPQPMGLGWHPYFPKRSRSRVHAEVEARWDTEATGLPTRAVPQPGVDGDVAHLAFDHCFEGFRGAARVRDERFSIKLTSSLPRLVVYTPQERPYFCVEPVSHVPNAIHMSDPAAHGLVTLAPGHSHEEWMKLEVAPV